MTEFYKAINDLFSYITGEEAVLKSFGDLSSEISALVGQADWAWIPWFLSPQNVLSLFIYGGMAYAACFILFYLPWQAFRALCGMPKKKRR